MTEIHYYWYVVCNGKNCENKEEITSSNWSDANDKIRSKGWELNRAMDEEYCPKCKGDDDQ